MIKMKNLYATLAVSLLMSLTACGDASDGNAGQSQNVQASAPAADTPAKTDGSAVPSAEQKVIRIAYLPITHSLAGFEAAELEKLKKDGLNIELVKFGSWTELMDALNTGHVDAAVALVELVMKAREQGVDVYLASLAHRDGNVIVVGNDIGSAADLKGKTFAIPHRQSSHFILLNEALAKECFAISDEDILTFREKKGIEDKLVFLYVGRLVELKGLRQLLEAWNIAKLDATFLIVGDGPERPVLENFCKQHGIHAVFAGAIDYANIPIFYRTADCFIIPTLQDNWSLVVPEAMACGLPVASSIYNGCHPELVHPENGWTFDPYDTHRTAEILKGIVNCKNELSAMGVASRAIVASHTPQKTADAIYNACLKVKQDHSKSLD